MLCIFHSVVSSSALMWLIHFIYLRILVLNTIFHIRCWSCQGTVTRRVPLVGQKLSTFLENLSSLLFYLWVHVAQSLVFDEVLCRLLLTLSFCLFFLFVNVLSDLLQFTASGDLFCFYIYFQTFLIRYTCMKFSPLIM